MKKVVLSTVSLGLLLAAPSAFAQTPCPPGSWLCAEVQIGGFGGSAVIGRAPPVVMQAPPPVYAPPPPVYYAPPRVYYAPPPVVVYQPAPMYVQRPVEVSYQMPPTMRQTYVPPQQRNLYVGLQGVLSGSFLGVNSRTHTVSGMGGLSAGLRFRTRGVLGGELAAGIFGGRDYNGDGRFEVPVSGSLMLFVNPQNAFQVYFLAGPNVSFAGVSYALDNSSAHGGLGGARYMYIGGHAGVGAELQISPRFSMFFDFRAFIRGRIDGARESNPEFARTLYDGSTQTSNTSIGVTGNLGAVVYF
jgi:hypothetical protein